MYDGPAVKWVGNAIGAGMLVVASAVVVGKVSSVQRKIVELEREAHTDHLTGLKNRRASEKRLQEDLLTAGTEAERATKRRPPSRSLMLVTADLDGLKQVNDRYGHEAGDRYIKSFARLLEDNLRADDWAGRLGGDEFVVVLWDVEGSKAHDGAWPVINRLMDITRGTVVELPGGHKVTLSASFGVASSSGSPAGAYAGSASGRDLPHLYKRADLALLQAKRRGKDRIVCA